jgi:hypothetical protein
MFTTFAEGDPAHAGLALIHNAFYRVHATTFALEADVCNFIVILSHECIAFVLLTAIVEATFSFLTRLIFGRLLLAVVLLLGLSEFYLLMLTNPGLTPVKVLVELKTFFFILKRC